MRRSELRVIPRHPDSRSGPRRPVSLHPHVRHLSSGPVGHGKRAGRKSGAKANRISLAGNTDPGEACASRSLLDCSSEPLLSLAMRARWDGGPFAFFYTSAPPAEAFVPIVLPRRITPFRKPRGFSPWESNDGRDRSLGHSTGPPHYATVIRFCSEEWPRLCYRRSLPGADGSKQGVVFGSTGLVGSVVTPGHPVAAPLRLLRLVRSRN